MLQDSKLHVTLSSTTHPICPWFQSARVQVGSWSTVLEAADTSKRIRNDTRSSSIIDKGLSANTNMCCDFSYQVVCKQPCITDRISREISVALSRKKNRTKVCWHELMQSQRSWNTESRIIWPSTEGSGIWLKDLGSVSYREEIFKEITKIKLKHIIVWKNVWFKTGIYLEHSLCETSLEALFRISQSGCHVENFHMTQLFHRSVRIKVILTLKVFSGLSCPK